MAALEIACFYAGFGFREYRKAVRYMVQSARDHNPGVVLTHVTDRHTPELEGFDRVVRMDKDISHGTVVSEKLICNGEWAQNTDCDRTVFVDPDIIFNQTIEYGDWDIGVLYHLAAPHRCFNGGLIYSTKQGKTFWEIAAYNAQVITKDVKHWWAEQIVLCCMLGMFHRPGAVLRFHDVRVGILDMHKVCPKIKEMPEKQLDTQACHFTSVKKVLMKPYYDLGRLPATQRRSA